MEWAIYREFCEASPVIWTVRPGTQGCMTHDQLGKRVLGIVSLGRDEYGAIVATPDRRLFFNNHKLKHGMKLDFLNSPANIEILTWGPPSYSFSLQQFLGNDILQQCLIKGRHSFFGYYKIQLKESKNSTIFLAKNLCFTNRVTLGDNAQRVQVLPSEIDFDILQSSSEEVQLNCKKYSKIDDQFEPDQFDFSREVGEKVISSPRLIEKRVDEETQKIALRLISHHFNEDNLQLTFEEWEFLEIAKQIFFKACPENMVSPFFINQIHLLFQAVLHESFKLFPSQVIEDQETRDRIKSALNLCLTNSTVLQFKDGAMCTSEAPLLKKEMENGTKVHVLVEMPAFIKVDVVNYDLIMEGIWKLMNFAHYYCAEYYEHLGSDHSLLEGRWYSLLSPHVVRRWKYPGRSYRVMQQLFSSINLERSVKNLDFCVSAARLHSSYKGWLKRPLSHEGLESGAKPIWDGQSYCMNDYMYPAFKLGYPIEKCGIRLPVLPRRSLI
ncbi:hypothetical protein Ocin01_02874 [Orchesella cincta]|uniref:Uncharacterized protein n=1 Tax=Orchesella cincta TaxID=48709 RepID=A0A1D2NF05_ORCCI|nr:hypothetical protein Ocin01_02874 [Orchesella cincta]